MISTVSIEGIDDSVDPKDLVDISQEYPFVEWGINLCPNVRPAQQFPSEAWLKELLFYTDKLRLRGILHGRWHHDILKGKISIKTECKDIWNSIQRVQVDVRKGHKNIIDALQLIPNKEIILYTNNYNSIVTGMRINAHPLLPEDQLFKYSEYCGYSIKNKHDLSKSLCPNFWISVNGFRSSTGSLSLIEVEKFLDSVENSVCTHSIKNSLFQTIYYQKEFSNEVEDRKISNSR